LRWGEAAKGTDEVLAPARGEIDLLKAKLAELEARLTDRR
jgi:BMFP domain-containing protein YqiC